MTDGTNEKIQEVVDSGVVPNMVKLLCSGTLSVVTPSLRSLGNIVTGSDTQTDAVVNAGALAKFGELLRHPKMNIVKEAAWTISNITAGNVEQIQKVIDAAVLPELVKVLRSVRIICMTLTRAGLEYLNTDSILKNKKRLTYFSTNSRETSKHKRKLLGLLQT